MSENVNVSITQSQSQSQAQAQPVPRAQSQNALRSDQDNVQISNQSRNRTLSQISSTTRARKQWRASIQNKSDVSEQHSSENFDDELDTNELSGGAKVPMGWVDPRLRGGRMLDVRSRSYVFFS